MSFCLLIISFPIPPSDPRRPFRAFWGGQIISGPASSSLSRMDPPPRQDLRRSAARLEAYWPMPGEPVEAMAWDPIGAEGIWIDHNPHGSREMMDHHLFHVLSTAPPWPWIWD